MYSIAELAERSGGDIRTIKFWVEAGALVPTPETDRAGRGVHRKFSRDELIVCCFLAAAFNAGAQIGRIKDVAGIIRSDLGDPVKRAEIEQGINGTLVPLLNIGHNSVSFYVVSKGQRSQNVVSVMTERKSSWLTSINVLPWLDKVPKAST